MKNLLEKHVTPAIWWVGISIIVASCGINDLEFANLDIPDYEPTLVVPLGVASYTMLDLVNNLGDTALQTQEGEDFFLTIVYSDTSYFNQKEAFVYFPPITKSDIIYPLVSAAPDNSEEVLEFEQTVTFSFDPFFGERVDSIFFNTGDLLLEINSRFRSNLWLEFSFPSLLDMNSGQSVTLSDSLNYSTRVPVDSRQSISLARKQFSFQRVSDRNNFDVVIKGKVIVKPGQSVNFSDFFRYTLQFSEPGYSKIHGFFEEKEGQLQSNSIDLTFFEIFGDVGLEFNDPKIKLVIDNSFGFPSGLLLDRLSASNNEADSILLTGQVTESLHFVNYPGVDSVGGKNRTEVVITKDNSNIRELFAITPIRFNLPMTVISNPTAFERDNLNFMTDSSFYRTITIMELPFDVKMSEFITNLEYNVDNLEIDNLENLELRLFSENEMPLEGFLTVSFTGEDDSVLYEVPEKQVLTSPATDSLGRSVEAKTLVSEIKLEQDAITALKDAKKVKLAVVINTFRVQNNEYVKLYADYTLDIDISIVGKLRIKTN